MKSPYTAAVSVPSSLSALMSANLESEAGEPHTTKPEYTTFRSAAHPADRLIHRLEVAVGCS